MVINWTCADCAGPNKICQNVGNNKSRETGSSQTILEEIFSKPKDLKTCLNQYRAYQIYASNTLQLIFTTT